MLIDKNPVDTGNDEASISQLEIENAFSCVTSSFICEKLSNCFYFDIYLSTRSRE